MILKKLVSLFTEGLETDVEQRTAGQDVIMQTGNANSFGQSSKGIKQIRGNGALILTRQEIQFLMAVPRSKITIPLSQVTSVSLLRSHLGKTVFKPLLWVEYQSLEGPDSIAWAVQHPEQWKSAIENASKKR